MAKSIALASEASRLASVILGYIPAAAGRPRQFSSIPPSNRLLTARD